MPIYEFSCTGCGHEFELLYPNLRRAQQDEAACPRCGTDQVERLVSQVSLGGRVQVGPGRAAYPYTWEQVEGGKPAVLRYWRERIEKEQREEIGDPELTMRRGEEAARRWAAAGGTRVASSHSRSLDATEVNRAGLEAPGHGALDHGKDGHRHGDAHSHAHSHGWDAIRFVLPRPPGKSEAGAGEARG